MVSINELHDVHRRKKKNHQVIYQKIYDKCCARIKHANNILFLKECVYNIPTILWGHPLYDMKACACFLILRLRKEGFTVNYSYPNTLQISWHYNEEAEELEDMENLNDSYEENRKVYNDELEKSKVYKEKNPYKERYDLLMEACKYSGQNRKDEVQNMLNGNQREEYRKSTTGQGLSSLKKKVKVYRDKSNKKL